MLVYTKNSVLCQILSWYVSGHAFSNFSIFFDICFDIFLGVSLFVRKHFPLLFVFACSFPKRKNIGRKSCAEFRLYGNKEAAEKYYTSLIMPQAAVVVVVTVNSTGQRAVLVKELCVYVL